MAGLVWACGQVSAGGGDLLVVHARLRDYPGLDAVLVRHGVITFLGKSSELRARASRDLEVLDARGGLVLPGFHDAHLHLEDGGAALGGLDLSGAADLDDACESVREFAASHPGSAWIEGRGWSYDLAGPGKSLSRAALDAVVPDRPVFLESYDGHAYWTNSRALELAGVGPETSDPEGGEIGREGDGRTPSGLLLEAAADLVAAVVPEASREVRVARVLRAQAALLALGVTSVEDMNCDLDAPELYRELAREGRLWLRVGTWLPLGTDLDEVVAARDREVLPRVARQVRVAGLKGYVDGVIESRTALMLAPYPGSSELGGTAHPREWLRSQVLAADQRDIPVALHCVGDGAVRFALDLIAEARRIHPEGPRHRLEHLEVVDAADRPRFRQLGVAASMQPLHALPEDGEDSGRVEDLGPWARNLGPARLSQAFPWRSLAVLGTHLAFGSDWPVVVADPLRGLAVAITRRGERRSEREPRQHPETLPVAAALRGYSLGAAWAAGVEKRRGCLADGLWGDLVVLAPGVDPEQPETLWRGVRGRGDRGHGDRGRGDRVAATVVAGVIRYAAGVALPGADAGTVRDGDRTPGR